MAFPLWSWCTEKRYITQALHTYTLMHQRLLIETPGCPLGDRARKPPLKSSCHYPHSPPPDHCPFLPALQFISELFRSFLPPLVRPRTLRYTPKKQSLTHACKQISENACPHTWHSFRAGLVGSSMHSLWAILASPYVLPVVHRSSFNLYRIRTQGTSMERTRVSLGHRLWSSICFCWIFRFSVNILFGLYIFRVIFPIYSYVFQSCIYAQQLQHFPLGNLYRTFSTGNN